jgi:Ni/Co efflux regulator RcnB
MLRKTSLVGLVLTIAFAGVLTAGPAQADKPSWAGEKGGKGREDEQGARRERGERASDEQGRRGQRMEHFGEHHRAAVREYYGREFESKRCPPGLAKKRNGCMPPGQARKWEFGRPLPREVVYYEVPQPLVVKLGQPPKGYRYVRVAGDILMIAVGTAMVVDAIHDLGK